MQPDTTPPQNIPAEQAALACSMLDADACAGIVVGGLLDTDFFQKGHRLLFEAICGLYHEGKPIDLVTTYSRLRDLGHLNGSINWDGLLAFVEHALVSPAHAKQYVADVRRVSLERQAIKIGSDLTADILEDHIAGEEALQASIDASTKALVLRDSDQAGVDAKSGVTLALEAYDRSDEAHAKRIWTGFDSLDRMIRGFRAGHSVVLAGRPGAGKTSFAVALASQAAKHGQGTLVVSLEMEQDELWQRIMTIESGVSEARLEGSMATEEDWSKQVAAAAKVSEWPLFITHGANVDFATVRRWAQRYRTEKKIQFLVVDYLQLLSTKREERRELEIAVLSRSFKVLAGELGIPVLVLCQLNRSPDHREDHRPRLSDLREGGCVAAGTRLLTGDGNHSITCLTSGSDRAYCVCERGTSVVETVTAVWDTGVKPMWRMTLSTGHQITATGNHKFLAFNNTWVPLADLQQGQQVAIPLNMRSEVVAAIAGAEARLLGLMVSNGCGLKNRSIQLTLNALDTDLAAIAARDAATIFGKTLRPHGKIEVFREKHRAYVMYFPATQLPARGHHSPMVVWLTKHGLYDVRAAEKHVPDAIFQQPPGIQADFLRALFAGDGTTNDKPSASRPSAACVAAYSTSSRGLADDVQLLLQCLGILGSIRKVTSRGFVWYNIDIEDFTSRSLFVEKVGFLSGRKQATMKSAFAKVVKTRRGWSRFTRLDDLCYVPIKSIVPVDAEIAWDASVSKTHNFIANGIVAHNSLEQDSDVVMFVWQPKLYGEDDAPGDAEIVVAKNRSGPTGGTWLRFIGQACRFKELEGGGADVTKAQRPSAKRRGTRADADAARTRARRDTD